MKICKEVQAPVKRSLRRAWKVTAWAAGAVAAAMLTVLLYANTRAGDAAELVSRSLGYPRLCLRGTDWGSLGRDFVAVGELGTIRGTAWCSPFGECRVRVDTQPLRALGGIFMPMRCDRHGCVFTPKPFARGREDSAASGEVILNTRGQRP